MNYWLFAATHTGDAGFLALIPAVVTLPSFLKLNGQREAIREKLSKK